MTLEECYQSFGGDYAQAAARFPSVALLGRFVVKFLKDPSFDALCAAFAAGNRAEAFRAAHTLKGLSANFSFQRLYASSAQLTETLRPEGEAIPAAAAAELEQVRRDYELTASALRTFVAAG